MQYLRQNKHLKCNVKWELLEENKTTWKWNGLSDLKYKLLGEEALGDHGTKVKVDIELNGHWANDMSEEKRDSQLELLIAASAAIGICTALGGHCIERKYVGRNCSVKRV